MKSKVSVNLVGGIGNNLFQIACAYAYSLKYNKQLILINKKTGIVHNSLETYKDNILSKINFEQNLDVSKFTVYNEPFFHYQEIPFIEGDVLLNGYFQSEKYFKDYKNEIVELFSFSENVIEKIKEKYKNELEREICSIHVRRGDYLNYPNHHPVQSINYYMRAIRKMPDDSLFLIFSDDIDWCKENFPNIEDKFIFIENNTDYEDLCLVSMCKNNILANSSFSCWGNFLNRNVNNMVFAPSKWFGSANNNNNTKDLYCERWNII